MKPIAGRRILLTRTREACAAWAREIERAGGHAVSLPCIRVETDRSDRTRARLAAAARAATWITFGSRRGVQGCRELLDDLPEGLRVAAVGPATAEAASAAWGRCDLVAPGGTAISLGETLAGRLAGRNGYAPSAEGATVVVVAADGGREDIEDALSNAGVTHRRVEIYRTLWEPRAGEDDAPVSIQVDTVLLASPSAARGLAARMRLGPEVEVITIGPSTSEAARAAGLNVTAEARERSLAGLLEAIP